MNNLLIINHSLFNDIYKETIPDEVLNILLVDLVKSNKVSIRLFHCICKAHDEKILPFKTIRDYLHAGKEAFLALQTIPNLGKKSALEFHVLIHNLVNEAQLVDPKNNPAHSDKEINLQSRHEIYNTPILKLVQTFGVSVRLENCIKQAYQDNNLPFQTIGDYLQAGNKAFRKLLKLPNLGKKSALELHDLICSLVQDPTLVDYQIDPELSNELPYNPLIEASKPITINTLLSTLTVKQKEVLELRYGLNFNPTLTLEQVGSIFEVTRERIRQVEAKAMRLLRKQFSDWAKNELASKSQELWVTITKGYLAIPTNPNYSIKKLLSSEDFFLIDIAYTNLNEWLDTISKSSSLGRISLSEDLNRIQEIHSEIENYLKTSPSPIHLSTLENKLKISNLDLCTTLQLTNGISFYGSYISKKAIGKRLKRTFRAHSILVSKASQGTISLSELKEIYLKIFHDDACSERDFLIVMTATPHLFLNCYDHGWVGLGCADDINSLSKLEENEPTTEDTENEESNDSNLEGASQILKEILKKYGPQKFDVIRGRFIKLSNNKYSKSSVGPLLILREDFIRLAPGVYSLKSHLTDKLAIEQAENVLLDMKQAELYCHAKFAGEQFNSFPLWTPKMEYLWAKWAKNTKHVQLLQSLLNIANPSIWPISENEKFVWQNLKEKEAYFHFLESNPIDLTETLPSLRNIVAVAVVAKKNGHLNWMSANRAMGLRVDDRHARSILALLVALKIIEPANHWQLKHLFNQESSTLIEDLKNALSIKSSIESLIRSRLNSSHGSIGWIRHNELQDLIEAWTNSISSQPDTNNSGTSMLESLDDLIKYVQIKKTEEAIYD